MDKILPKVNIQEIQRNNIINKIIPINIIFYPTTYKKVNTNIITFFIQQIKNILSIFKFFNVFKLFDKNYFSKIKKPIKKILKPIKKIAKKILKLIIKPFKFLRKLLFKLSKNIFKIIYKLIKNVINILFKLIQKITKLIIKISKYIVSTSYKLLIKGFKFLKTAIKNSIKLIQLMVRARKFLGLGKITDTFKMIGGKIKNSPKTIKEFFKTLPQIIKNTKSQIFSTRVKISNKTRNFKKVFEQISKSVINNSKDLINWFKLLGKKYTESKLFKQQINKLLEKLGKKFITKLILTLISTVAIGSFAGAIVGLIILVAKSLIGFGVDLMLVDKINWRNIIIAMMENLPYLDLIFSLDHAAADILGTSLDIFYPTFNWLTKDVLSLTDEQLDKDLLENFKSKKQTQELPNNVTVLNNINNITDNKNIDNNIINIFDEIYNEQNFGLLNIINNHIEHFYNILNYRNKSISKLAV